LRAFFSAIPRDTYAAPTFVGHYISGFDLRFILCRAVILGVQIPPCIPRDAKPWGKDVFDTMTAWAGTKDKISQDRLARALGLAGKGDFDGGMVAAAWLAGEHHRIDFTQLFGRYVFAQLLQVTGSCAIVVADSSIVRIGKKYLDAICILQQNIDHASLPQCRPDKWCWSA
jgi:hypothetical protein